jgi:peptidoglycan/xylan/chitin deacetylase (PgdA/CDA1 family)
MAAFVYAVYLRIFRPGPRRIILYYHSVRAETLPAFARQMEYLARTCQVVPICQIVSVPFTQGKHLVSITFDDAFVSVRDQAIPVLEGLGLRASIFVPVGLLGRRPDWGLLEQAGDQDETVMDSEDLRTLQQRGFEIYSHTLSHPFLTHLDVPQMQEELHQSRRRLGDLLGQSVDAVSYPHGDYNRTVLEEAKRAGYKWGFTIEPRMITMQTDPLAMGRFSVSPSEGLLTFRLKAMGAYQACDWLRKMKAKFLRK